MSALGNLFRHSLSYFSGHLVVLLAGLISLPIMTRLLSKEDYGLMSLVFLATTVATSLFALGIPQSTTRYFAEYAQRGQESLKGFCTTMLIAMITIGTIAMFAFYLGGVLLSHTESFRDMAVYLNYAVALILIRLVSSVCLQILRGNQQTLAFNLYNIVNRYLTIGAIVLLIVFVFHNVAAVFVGTIVVEAGVLLVACAYLWRRKLIGLAPFESSVIPRAIKFGVPLVIADLMVSLVASSDRFVIKYFLDADAVAIYSVAYDVSDYVAALLAKPLQLAILPIVYKLWSTKGTDATKAFLDKAISLSMIVVIPMIAGFSLVGPDLVVTLASEKYAESGNLVPVIAFGVMIGSINFLLFTGLLLHEKTTVITILNGSAAAMNLALNLLLIPRFGIIGAAYATIATYVLLNMVTYFISGRFLPVRLDGLLITKSIAATAVMALAVISVPDFSEVRALNALSQSATGAIVYLGVMYAIDSSIRVHAYSVFEKLGIGRSASP